VFFTIAAFLACVLYLPCVRACLRFSLSLSRSVVVFVFYLCLSVSLVFSIRFSSLFFFFWFGRDGVTHVDDDE